MCFTYSKAFSNYIKNDNEFDWKETIVNENIKTISYQQCFETITFWNFRNAFKKGLISKTIILKLSRSSGARCDQLNDWKQLKIKSFG